MSALPKPDYLQNPLPQRLTNQRRRGATQQPRQAVAIVKPLVTPSTPAWVNHLLRLRQGSTVVAWCLVGVTLPIYAFNVFAQHSWGQDYRELEALQQSERELSTELAVRRFRVVEHVEKDVKGLVRQGPSTSLFLQPAPVRQQPSAETSAGPTTPIVPVSY